MPKNKIVVGYDEIFEYAEKMKGWCWNECCEIFHGRGEILYSPESSNKNFYREDLRSDMEYMKNNPDPKRDTQRMEAYEVILSFMDENDIKEMIVTND